MPTIPSVADRSPPSPITVTRDDIPHQTATTRG